MGGTSSGPLMTVRRKIFITILSASVLLALGFDLVMMGILRDVVRSGGERRLRDEVALLAELVAGMVEDQALIDLAKQVGLKLGVRVTLIDKDGNVLADSTAGPNLQNHLSRPEIAAARLGGIGEDLRISETTGVGYFYTARSVQDGRRVAYVRGAAPKSELEKVPAPYAVLLLASGLAVVLLVSAVAYLLVVRISAPVERMINATAKVAAGDLGQVVPDVEVEELGRLAAAVNRMKHALLRKLEELEDERGLLVAMREGMEEGLLLIGRDHRILMANGAFRRIFRVHFDPTGHLLGEAVRHPAVIAVVDEALATAEDRRETVSGTPGSDRSFEVHLRTVAIPGSEGERGVLVLFFDITRLEALERVRRQFVADVSHELRTPVTSIKGAIETLLDGDLIDQPEARRFLEMAQRQSDRMTELIADLTDLSLIETGAIQLDIHTIDLGKLSRDVAEAVAHRYPDRQVEVRSEVASGLLVNADRRRLEQILVNLVDNGMKFNRPGGSVVIRAESRNGSDAISVEDTGVGIQAESLDRIFQRFYRVDRARSREVGGTGLGLAIVKHLVHLHHGEVKVESEPGIGTRFTIELPRQRES